jgi:hypothetical protein
MCFHLHKVEIFGAMQMPVMFPKFENMLSTMASTNSWGRDTCSRQSIPDQ